jgi:hypothetical protein
VSGAITTARRIASRVTIAWLGPLPEEADDPASDDWWELHNAIVKTAEDEIGRATLLQLGQEKTARGVLRDLVERMEYCHPNTGGTGTIWIPQDLLDEIRTAAGVEA